MEYYYKTYILTAETGHNYAALFESGTGHCVRILMSNTDNLRQTLFPIKGTNWVAVSKHYKNVIQQDKGLLSFLKLHE